MISTTYVNPRHEYHYFIADVGELPEALRENDNIGFYHSVKKYAVVGVSSAMYYEHIAGNGYEEMTTDEALKFHKYASEVRTQHSVYWRNTETNQTTKGYVGVTTASLNVALDVMKRVGVHMNNFVAANTPNVSDTPFAGTVLTKLNEASTMGEINIVYENYFHIDMPKPQAESLNLIDEDGNRTYQAERTTTDYLGQLL